MQGAGRVLGVWINQKIIINKEIEGRCHQKGEKLYTDEKRVQSTQNRKLKTESKTDTFMPRFMAKNAYSNRVLLSHRVDIVDCSHW